MGPDSYLHHGGLISIFGGSDLEEERFHGPVEVEDSEEAVRQQAAMEDDLAEAYRVDAIRNRTIRRLRDGAEEARVRAEFDAAEAMDAEADLLGVMWWWHYIWSNLCTSHFVSLCRDGQTWEELLFS